MGYGYNELTDYVDDRGRPWESKQNRNTMTMGREED